MTDEITILLADDHNVLRQGMAQMLDAQADMKVVAQASDGSRAVNLARRHRPDIILMDIKMPEMDGVEAARRITAELPETGIIILTMYRRDDYVFEAIKAGASASSILAPLPTVCIPAPRTASNVSASPSIP